MRRIERLINLIAALLETSRPLSAEEIRTQIAGYDQPSDDAFRRSFERDKEALRAMGIPLEIRQTDMWADTRDGYIIPKGKYYLPQLDLEPDELAALKIAAESVLGGGEDAELGWLKLSVDSPGTAASGPRLVWGADVAARGAPLSALYAALLDRTAVTFEYESQRSGETSRRAVETYGLVHRRGHWYAVGKDTGDEVVKAFKLSRISSEVASAGTTYDIPEGADASKHLRDEAWEIGSEEPTVAVVRFSSKMRWWAEQNLADAVKKEGDDGALDVEFSVANLSALISWAIEFGGEFEIVSPDAAKQQLLDHLAPLLKGAAT